MLTMTKDRGVSDVGELRKQLVTYCASVATSSTSSTEGLLLRKEIEGCARARSLGIHVYLKGLGEDGTWCDTAFQMAFTQMFECDVVSWEHTTVSGKEELRHCSSYVASNHKRVLHLAHVIYKGEGKTLNHFQVVEGVSASIQARTVGGKTPDALPRLETLYNLVFSGIETKTTDDSYLLPADVFRRMPLAASFVRGSICISARKYVDEEELAKAEVAKSVHVVDVSGNSAFSAHPKFPNSYKVYT
jgi:hypothetical protein